MSSDQPTTSTKTTKGPSTDSVTDLLLQWNEDRKSVIDQLMPVVEGELKKLAVGHMVKERAEHTLQPTALVNELYFRLIDRERVNWQSRAQFYAFASHSMRRILVDYARGKRSAKRGGGEATIQLDEALGKADESEVDLLDLDQALKDLAKVDEELARIVEMRFFAGLNFDEIASVLEVSPATISRRWTMAKGWLFRYMDS